MSGQHQTTHAAQSPPAQVAARTHLTTPEERQERKQRLQTHGRSSVTRGIADVIVIKAGDIFFLSEPMAVFRWATRMATASTIMIAVFSMGTS